MPILVTCKCGKKFRADEKHEGKRTACPKCSQSLAIEGPLVSAYDVFVSYSSKDKTTCDALVATFERKGMRCWIAPRDILPGQNWGEAIIGGIEQSRVIVLVFSSHSNESPQVKREVERAVSKGIPVVPLRIEDVKLSRAMEYFISSQHWLDALSPPLEKHLEELARKVMRLLTADGSASSPDSRSSPDPFPAALHVPGGTPPAPDTLPPAQPTSPSNYQSTSLAAAQGKTAGPSRPWWWLALGGVATLLVLLVFRLFLPAADGRIKINIPNSATKLTVKLDGETLELAELSEPMRLKVGEHRLEVTGPDIESEDNAFRVNVGENPTLHVTLKSKPRAQSSISAVVKTRDSEPVPSGDFSPRSDTSIKSNSDADDATDVDRRSAQWVQSVKGFVDLQIMGQASLRRFGADRPLPDEQFQVVGVNLYLNANADDVGMGNLKGLRAIKNLNIHGAKRISNQGLRNAGLSEMQTLENLAPMALSVDFEILEEVAGLPNLRELTLDSRRNPDEALELLDGLKKLETLSLSGTSVTDAGLKHLFRMQSLKSVRLVNAEKVSAAGVGALHAALPNCKVIQ